MTEKNEENSLGNKCRQKGRLGNIGREQQQLYEYIT